MSILDNPAIIGFIVGIPSLLLGYLGYRRSLKIDKVAEQTGAASSQFTGVAQVIAGLNGLIDHLQEDNKTLRLRLKELAEEHDAGAGL